MPRTKTAKKSTLDETVAVPVKEKTKKAVSKQEPPKKRSSTRKTKAKKTEPEPEVAPTQETEVDAPLPVEAEKEKPKLGNVKPLDEAAIRRAVLVLGEKATRKTVKEYLIGEGYEYNTELVKQVQEKLGYEDGIRQDKEKISGIIAALRNAKKKPNVENIQKQLTEENYVCMERSCTGIIEQMLTEAANKGKPRPDETIIRRAIQDIGQNGATTELVQQWLEQRDYGCQGEECKELVHTTLETVKKEAEEPESEKVQDTMSKMPTVYKSVKTKRGRVTEPVVAEAIEVVGADYDKILSYLISENWPCKSDYCKNLIRDTLEKKKAGVPVEVEKKSAVRKSSSRAKRAGPAAKSAARKGKTTKSSGKKAKEQLPVLPELTEEQLKTHPKILRRAKDETEENFALRSKYTKAAEKEGIPKQTAIVYGFMAVKRARYNVGYDKATEDALVYLDSLVTSD